MPSNSKETAGKQETAKKHWQDLSRGCVNDHSPLSRKIDPYILNSVNLTALILPCVFCLKMNVKQNICKRLLLKVKSYTQREEFKVHDRNKHGDKGGDINNASGKKEGKLEAALQMAVVSEAVKYLTTSGRRVLSLELLMRETEDKQHFLLTF